MLAKNNSGVGSNIFKVDPFKLHDVKYNEISRKDWVGDNLNEHVRTLYTRPAVILLMMTLSLSFISTAYLRICHTQCALITLCEASFTIK